MENTLQQHTVQQSLVIMNILDYLIFADDPSYQSIYKLNLLVRKHDLVDWLEKEEPRYYWNDQQMEEAREEIAG